MKVNIAEILRWWVSDALITKEMAVDRIIALIGKKQPDCGHPVQCIIGTDEGTNYCGWCDDIKTAEVQKANALEVLGDTWKDVADDYLAKIAELEAQVEKMRPVIQAVYDYYLELDQHDPERALILLGEDAEEALSSIPAAERVLWEGEAQVFIDDIIGGVDFGLDIEDEALLEDLVKDSQLVTLRVTTKKEGSDGSD